MFFNLSTLLQSMSIVIDNLDFTYITSILSYFDHCIYLQMHWQWNRFSVISSKIMKSQLYKKISLLTPRKDCWSDCADMTLRSLTKVVSKNKGELFRNVIIFLFAKLISQNNYFGKYLPVINSFSRYTKLEWNNFCRSCWIMLDHVVIYSLKVVKPDWNINFCRF